MNFLECFMELKDEKGITLSAISKETGIPATTLSNYVNRGSQPSGEQLSILADYFGVTVDYLLGREEQVRQVPAASSNALDPEEEELLRIFRNASRGGKNILLGNARNVEKNDEYLKKERRA